MERYWNIDVSILHFSIYYCCVVYGFRKEFLIKICVIYTEKKLILYIMTIDELQKKSYGKVVGVFYPMCDESCILPESKWIMKIGNVPKRKIYLVYKDGRVVDKVLLFKIVRGSGEEDFVKLVSRAIKLWHRSISTSFWIINKFCSLKHKWIYVFIFSNSSYCTVLCILFYRI